MWDEVEPDNFRSGLSAALTVCAVSKESAALEWALELWSWANGQKFEMDKGNFCDYLKVLETHNQCDQVNVLLPKFQKHLNNAVLGAVLDSAAMQHNWQRGEELWDVIVNKLGVKPGLIQYVVRAKLHMLCARPATATHIFEMAGKEVTPNCKFCIDYLQALLVVHHSSLSNASYHQLEELLEYGEAVIEKDHASQRERKEWERLKRVVQR